MAVKGQGLICQMIAYLFYISACLQTSRRDVALGVKVLWHTIPAFNSMIEVI